MHSLSRLILFVTLCVLSLTPFVGAPVHGQTPDSSPKVVLAEDPRDLIKFLPDAPPNWKITVSNGSNRITSIPSLTSTVTRIYLYVPPPAPAAVPPVPKSPQTTMIRLVDSAYDPEKMAMFANFKPSSNSNSGVQKTLVKDCPALEFTGKDSEAITIQLSPRFLVTLALKNQDDAAKNHWIETLKIPELLTALKSAPENPLPLHVLTMINFDELNPANNATYQTHYYTAEEIAETQKELNSHPPNQAFPPPPPQ